MRRVVKLREGGFSRALLIRDIPNGAGNVYRYTLMLIIIIPSSSALIRFVFHRLTEFVTLVYIVVKRDVIQKKENKYPIPISIIYRYIGRYMPISVGCKTKIPLK